MSGLCRIACHYFQLQQNCFVRRLRLRAQKAQSSWYCHWVVKNVKFVNHYKWGFNWIQSSRMTKTFRYNCDIDIVQQTSCELLFPNVHLQLDMYFFVPSLCPCMHHNYGAISGIHACRDCVWPIILGTGLNTTCRGERVLVFIRFKVQCNIPTFEALLRKNVHLFLKRSSRKSKNVWLRTFVPSDV